MVDTDPCIDPQQKHIISMVFFCAKIITESHGVEIRMIRVSRLFKKFLQNWFIVLGYFYHSNEEKVMNNQKSDTAVQESVDYMIRWSRTRFCENGKAYPSYIEIAKIGASQDVWLELAMSFFDQGLISHFRTCARKAGIDVGAYIDSNLPGYIESGEVESVKTCFRLLRRDPSRKELTAIMQGLNRKEGVHWADYAYPMQFFPSTNLVRVAIRKSGQVFLLASRKDDDGLDSYYEQLVKGLSSQKYCSQKIEIMSHYNISVDLVEDLLKYITTTKNEHIFEVAAPLLVEYSVSADVRKSFIATAVSYDFVPNVHTFRKWFGEDPSEAQCISWKENFLMNPNRDIHCPERNFGSAFTNKDKYQLFHAYIGQGKSWCAIEFSDVVDVGDKEYLINCLVDDGRMDQAQKIASKVGRSLTEDEIVRIAEYHRRKEVDG